METFFNIQNVLLWLKPKNMKKINPMHFATLWSFIPADL